MQGKHMMPGMPKEEGMEKDKKMAKKKKEMMKNGSYSKDTVAMARGMVGKS